MEQAEEQDVRAKEQDVQVEEEVVQFRRSKKAPVK
jgi:hypothetical protein